MLISLWGRSCLCPNLIAEDAEAPRGRQPELPSWLIVALGFETPRSPCARGPSSDHRTGGLNLSVGLFAGLVEPVDPISG